MLSLRVAYVGDSYGTSLHRARALERLGHHVTVIDQADYLPGSKQVLRWTHWTGGIGIGIFLNKPVFRAVAAVKPDVIWVDQGTYLGPALIRKLRSLSVPIVNYTIDDPFGGRDGYRFSRYIKALPFYDLLVVVREENVQEAMARGATNVMRVWRSSDEVAHKPRLLNDENRRKWSSDICFIGTWLPERGPFMAELIRAGLPLSIWGDNWPNAPEWPIIAPCWRGPGQYDDNVYAYIIQSAKICLGLLSKGNRDRHTTRCLEIPALGGLLVSEKTDEHVVLYENHVEAVFWENVEQCKLVCRQLLADSSQRETIARAGHIKHQASPHRNEKVISEVISRLKLKVG